MKWTIAGGCLVALMLWVTVLANAGTITLDFGTPLTITSTARHDAALGRLLSEINAQRASQGQPEWTIEQWLRNVLVNALESYQKEAGMREQGEACSAYKLLNPTQQNQINAALGGKSPCH